MEWDCSGAALNLPRALSKGAHECVPPRTGHRPSTQHVSRADRRVAGPASHMVVTSQFDGISLAAMEGWNVEVVPAPG